MAGLRSEVSEKSAVYSSWKDVLRSRDDMDTAMAHTALMKARLFTSSSDRGSET